MTHLTRVAALALSLAILPTISFAADIRAGIVRYDGGAAIYQPTDSQNVLCDSCQTLPTLVPAPPPRAIRFTEQKVEPVIEEPAESVAANSPVEVRQETSQVAVHFQINSDRLIPAEKMRIRQIMAKKAGAHVEVQVDGYTCRIGTKKYNDSLSMRRAKQVAAYLKSLGVSVSRIEGFGKEHPLGGTLQKDRRVEIKIIEKEQSNEQS